MVRCADCGFLTLKDHGAKEWIEAEERFREKGLPPASMNYDHQPTCFVRAVNLQDEIKSEKRTLLETIQLERPCLKFTRWNHGFTPKEHKEMELSKEEKRFQEERRDKDLAWQLEQRSNDRKWQEEQAARRRKWEAQQNNKNRLWNLTVALISGFAGALLGYYLRKPS